MSTEAPSVGDRVQALYSSDRRWYPATIESEKPDGSFTIAWDDGAMIDRSKMRHEVAKLPPGYVGGPLALPTQAAVSSRAGNPLFSSPISSPAAMQAAAVPMMSEAVAESMIDEVSLLEAALREAMDKKAFGSAESPAREAQFAKEYLKYGYSSTTRTAVNDTAVASYGVQLKGWIDMQVDQRLNVVLRSVLDGQMAVVRQEFMQGVSVARSDVEVLKGTQQKLLSVIENLSEELSKTKALLTVQEKANMEVILELKDSQARLSADIQSVLQRSINELRNETAAAVRSETAARAALDEQLWLTDQRLTQRINELDRSHHESITIINRQNGTPDKVVQKDFVKAVDEIEENTIHIRPPPPYMGGKALTQNGGEDPVYVERTVLSPRSPRSPLQFEDQSARRIQLKRVAHTGLSESPAAKTSLGSPSLRPEASRCTIVKEFVNEFNHSKPSGRLRLSGSS